MSMRTSFKFLLLIFLLLFLITTINIAKPPDPVRAKNGMVVSASKLASQVGVDILKKGGNAIDAAVAVGFALAVTYPSAGNIGGGGFMTIHLASGRNTTIDYREKAPSTAFENMYQDSMGNFLPLLSQEGVTSAGVPGSVAGLVYALEKYGTMPLSEIIQPAIELAANGFIIEYRLAKALEYEINNFNQYESSKKIFTKDSIPFQEGELLIQSDLATTLELIKDKGRDGFYKGEVAEKLIQQLQQLDEYISLEDLADYKAVERKPVESDYKNVRIISMGPPSAGGISLIQLLNILENFSFAKDDWGSSDYIHKLVEAMKYVFADRSKHLGDPDFYDVPVDWLISKEYAQEIWNRIGENATQSENILPGNNYSFNESEETTHYSVIDNYGNAVSTTTTINSSFGSKIVVDGAGFLLNNEMDDFSSKPGEANQFGLIGSEANKIEPGKRMLSSMTPTIILKDEKPFIVIGSPGGSTISTVVLQVILNVLEFGMNIHQAIDMPRIHHQWLPDKIDYEKFSLTKDVIESLITRGHIIGDEKMLGRAEGIIADHINHVFLGASDSRGYGAAIGY